MQEDPEAIKLAQRSAANGLRYAATVIMPAVIAYPAAVILKKLHADQDMRGIVGLALGAIMLVLCGVWMGRSPSPSVGASAAASVVGGLLLAPLIRTATGEPSSGGSLHFLFWLAAGFAGLVLGTMAAAAAMPRPSR